MNKVYVVDDLFDILMEASFRNDHANEMTNRGWISLNDWLKPGQEVCVINYKHLQEFFNEVAS